MLRSGLLTLLIHHLNLVLFLEHLVAVKVIVGLQMVCYVTRRRRISTNSRSYFPQIPPLYIAFLRDEAQVLLCKNDLWPFL